MYKTIITIAVLSASVWASIIDIDAHRKILNAKQNLEHISENSSMSPKLTNQLNRLRREAINLSEIIYSRKCNIIEINTIPDKTCDNFIRKSKKFNDTYARWTNSFFSSRVTLLKQSKNFRKKVNTCIEMMSSFLNPTMTPESLFPHELHVDIERRYETEVTISMKPKFQGKWTFHGNTSGFNRNGEYKYLKKYFVPWTKSCNNIAGHQGVLEQRFLEEVKNYWKDSPYTFKHEGRGTYTGLYVGFKHPRAYVIEILVNGKVIREVRLEYLQNSSKSTQHQIAMYVDVLPDKEIRLELGGPSVHYIPEWKVFIDGGTKYGLRGRQVTVSKTYKVPDGDVEVRLKK